MINDLGTGQRPTWCPGCANFVTLASVKKVLSELNAEGAIDIKKTVIVADIGCGAKIYDYLHVNAFYSLHGRVIPTAMGIKAGNPELTVICFGGDGGTYDEGMGHLIHASSLNPNITMIVGNNRVFALTKGQPTSSETKNPLSIASVAGASFIARGSVYDADHLAELMKRAITHEGFSLLEIMEPCLIFKNDAVEMNARTKKMEGVSMIDKLHVTGDEIPIGIFRKEERNTWEDGFRI